MKLLTLSLALASAASVFTSSASHAAQYCINSETAFFSALSTSAISVEDDEIRLVKGLLNINFNINSPQNINGDLSLRGGYDAGCSTRADLQAMTQIKAQDNSIELRPKPSSDIFIERMDFDGMEAFNIYDNFDGDLGAFGLIYVSRSAFRNANRGLWIHSFRHDVRVENSLFINNNQTYNSTGLEITNFFNFDAQQDYLVSVVNCTMRGNTHGVVINRGLAGPRLTPTLVNTISTDNVIDVKLARRTYIHHSMFKTLSLGMEGELTTGSGNNLSTDPLLDVNHRPKSGSLAIDSGDNAAVAVPLKARDYYGNTRIIGPTVDRGAVEKTVFGF